MIILCLGNEADNNDSLPVRIMPLLKTKLPRFNFVKYDPTEELISGKDGLIFIDTIVGIKKITVFNSLSAFTASPSISVHDYDLYLELSLRKKLKKLKDFFIIGLPGHLTPEKAAIEVCKILKSAVTDFEKVRSTAHAGVVSADN